MTGSGNSPLNELFRIIMRQTELDRLPFNPGCSPEAIENAENSLGVRLPEDYKAFLGSHDGQSDPYTLTFPPDQIAFLSIADVVTLWQELQQYRDDMGYEQSDPEGRVRNVLYHPGRIPIAHNESGVAYLFLDYIPGPKGKQGQLIFNVNEADVVLVSENFSGLLRDYMVLLQSGKMIVKKQPAEYGEGYWFESGKGEYIDWKVYKQLLATL